MCNAIGHKLKARAYDIFVFYKTHKKYFSKKNHRRLQKCILKKKEILNVKLKIDGI